MEAGRDSSRSVVVGYLSVLSLFTLASSLIWAINTIFLIRVGGLTIFEVMVVNAVFTLGQVVFEVPTGVVADTIGRRASLLLCMATLTVSTVLYVATPPLGLGIWGFIAASVIIGFGFTFETGALDAWLVDALDATGWEGAKDRVFSWGQMAAGAGMLIGSLLGGVLGQFGLSWPYIVRAILLVAAFAATFLLVRDLGFAPRPLKVATFGQESRRVFRAGTTYGWRSPVIRPILWSSSLTGVFFIFAWYVWQPYVLELLGRDYVWLLGVVTAAFSLAGIAGNALVSRIMRSGERRRDPTRVLATAGWVNVVLVVGVASVGLLGLEPGVGPAGVAIALWLAFGLVFGISGPIRMGYVNEHIPSAQRATVLSLDALFSDVGGSVGQPALGWVSTRASVSWALLIGSAFISGVPLLYRASGRAATREAELASKPLPLSEPCTPGGSVVGDLERQIPDYCPL